MYSHTEYERDDIDGNRGIYLVSYEIESCDTPTIIDQIHEFMEETREIPPNPFTVHLIDSMSEEDVYLDIDPTQYINTQHMQNYLQQLEE